MKVGPFTDDERDRDWLPEDVWASIPQYLHRSIEGYAARHRLAAFASVPAEALARPEGRGDEIGELRWRALCFVEDVQRLLLSKDENLRAFPMVSFDALLLLLDPEAIGRNRLVLISREQLARAAFNGRYAATVGKHGDFWEQLAEVGRIHWRAGAEAVIDHLAALGLPVKGVE